MFVTYYLPGFSAESLSKSIMLELVIPHFASIWTVLASTCVLIYGALTIRERVRIHGRLPLASTAIKINSRLYSVASLCFCLVIVASSTVAPETLRLWEGNRQDATQRHLYHLSKLYEYLDIFFVLANGGSVGRHFAFHHLTVSPRVLEKRCHLTTTKDALSDIRSLSP